MMSKVTKVDCTKVCNYILSCRKRRKMGAPELFYSCSKKFVESVFPT